MVILSSAYDLPPGRLLALDLGQVRIGVAVCDAGGVASPLTVLRRAATRAADFAAIAALVAGQRAAGVLVGMPLGSEGQAGPQARWVRRYAGRLAGALPVPLAFWDESLSTIEARRLLAESGARTAIDSAAAAVILSDFLEARRSLARP